jgi:acetyltransferase-like isoleucine patch superfamily enzyme
MMNRPPLSEFRPMPTLYQFVVRSDHPAALSARRLHRWLLNVSLPAPRLIVKPMLRAYVALRSSSHFARRVLVAEPLLKAYCSQYGRNLRADIYVPWVQGEGALILGDDVVIDGECGISFGARFCDRPTLSIGDRTGIGHRCRFTVGKRITIGRDCRIAAEVWIFDSSGHPTDPERRQAGLPPTDGEVRPVTIGDNVWIGGRSIVSPGVTIGEGSVVAAGSVVLSDVPPFTVVAGNPARKVATVGGAPQAAPSRPAGRAEATANGAA